MCATDMQGPSPLIVHQPMFVLLQAMLHISPLLAVVICAAGWWSASPQNPASTLPKMCNPQVATTSILLGWMGKSDQSKQCLLSSTMQCS